MSFQGICGDELRLHTFGASGPTLGNEMGRLRAWAAGRPDYAMSGEMDSCRNSAGSLHLYICVCVCVCVCVVSVSADLQD